MKKVVSIVSRMSFLLLVTLVMVTSGVANAAGGYFAVADPGGGVILYDLSTVTPTKIGVLHGPADGVGAYGITFGPGGDILITTGVDDAIYRAPYLGNGVWQDYSWSVVTTLLHPYLGKTHVDPRNMDYDAATNKLYAVGMGSERIYTYDFNTSTLTESAEIGIHGLVDVEVIGNKAWIASLGGNATVVGGLNLDTGLMESQNEVPDGNEFFGVGRDAQGDPNTILLADNNAGKIYKYHVTTSDNWDTANNTLSTFIATAGWPNSYPWDMELGDDHNGDGTRDYYSTNYVKGVVIYSGLNGSELGVFANPATDLWSTPRYGAYWDPTAVPEPSALAALMVGCVGLLGLRRRR